MALVLNVKVREGFWVVNRIEDHPDLRYVVESILDERTFVLRRPGTDLAYQIDPNPRDIGDNLIVNSGETTSRHSVRILIEAPRHLTILRDKLYHRGRNARSNTPKKG